MGGSCKPQSQRGLSERPLGKGLKDRLELHTHERSKGQGKPTWDLKGGESEGGDGSTLGKKKKREGMHSIWTLDPPQGTEK